MTKWIVSLVVVVIGRPVLTAADERPASPQQAVDFARDVFPILQRSCVECHGAKKQAGDLRLDRRRDAFQSGTIQAKRPDDSELLRRIRLPRGHDEIMPAIGEPLRSSQVDIISRWIRQGADWPEDFSAGKHWAYVVPQRADLPRVSEGDWIQSPIDAFVMRRLDEAGLRPAPVAAPEKLVRRVFLDLIGLPPTPEEVQAYLENPSDNKFAELVDDLLQRPQFGERWARPWLDLARYADSHGFQRDNLRDIWAYRDWVIRAMNADMPFDQFTLEQIAGDLLPDATESQRIATGFHRCTPTNVEAGSLPEETRIEQVIDRVNTTGAVWLGTTLECCQCHDHKYDPFSARDYYRLLAFFNSTEREADRANEKTPSSIKFNGPSMPLSDPRRDAKRAALQKQVAELKRQQTQRRRQLEEDIDSWINQLAKQAEQAPATHKLDISAFETQGSSDSVRRLDDGSFLLVGDDPPARDVYTIRGKVNLAGVTAFRLEALRHEELPGRGPGRGDAARRNFVLNDFSVRVSSGKNGTERELKFLSATASFSQKNWDVAGAIDDNPKTGWAVAPQFDRSHTATFQLAEPIELTHDSELTIRLSQQYGTARTIGCVRISAMTGNVAAESLPENIVKASATEPQNRTKQQRRALIDYRVKLDVTSAGLTKNIADVNKQIEQLRADTTLVMIELDKPRMSTIFERGDYRKPGEQVTPGTPEILHPLPAGPAASGGGDPSRITLAKWLVSRDNPLVARVTVNRWWGELFGQGLVTTPEDFGIKGEPPTHPGLLDWLAVEFMDNGWSMKKLLRTIVLSATYQQSSNVSSDLLALDDRNRLLARGPRFRMDAEMIRDNALAVSGLLSLKQFGPPIRPFQPAGIWRKVGGTAYKYQVSPGTEQYRRGVYVVIKRGSPYPSFLNFDGTARLACTVQRSRTNTPLQALTLLNDPVYVKAAEALAGRVLAEAGDLSTEEQIRHAFRICTARQPTERESAVLLNLLQQQTRTRDESAAWVGVATALLNLHETITKD